MKSNKTAMAGWYNPVSLTRTGLRVAISTVFGAFADRREMVAAANSIPDHPLDPAYDYSGRIDDGSFWFDYMADTGDGWASTFAMAQLLTLPRLHAGGIELPRGCLLVLGGDQVYPTASPEAYRQHFIEPFEAAYLKIHGSGHQEPFGDIYAIPGNHDWYDGLNAFDHLFCRRRNAESGKAGVSRPGKVIAGRKTNQTRSYFALKLPCGWWLWGTDSQIEGYIDQPQIDFFQYVASNWMKRESKLILCVGRPSWAYVDKDQPDKAFSSFSYLERLARMATDGDGKPLDHQLKLVISGDSHHYSRYFENDVQYVTAGGGGAFLHPTHQLKDIEFNWDYPPPGQSVGEDRKEYLRRFTLAMKQPPESDRKDIGSGKNSTRAIYPEAAISRRLTWRNLAFALINPGLVTVYFTVYLVIGWILAFNAQLQGAGSLISVTTARGTLGFVETTMQLLRLCLASPWPAILLAISIGAYRYFADEPLRPWRRFAIGLIHGASHAAVALLTMGMVLTIAPDLLQVDWSSGPAAWQTALITILLALASAIASTTLFGVYLLICLNLRNIHWNEAFSSLRIRHFKNFLRIHIDEKGLTIFPIGLDKVPRDGGDPSQLIPRIIEQPIIIPN